MSLINLEPFVFGGKPHFPSEMTTDGNFLNSWAEFERSSEVKRVSDSLKSQNFPLRFLGITQFGPENFIYWLGLLIPNQDFPLPKDWLKLNLPGGPGFALQNAAPANQVLPIRAELDAVYQSAQKEEVALPQNISHTTKPYFIEQLSLDNSAIPENWAYFVYQSLEEDPLED